MGLHGRPTLLSAIGACFAASLIGISHEPASAVSVRAVDPRDLGAFSNLGPSNTLNGSVYSLVVTDDTLYAGGTFSSPGDKVAGWNGSAWSAVGSGLDGWVLSLAYNRPSQTVYAGGNFTGNVSRWDGSSWTTLGTGVNGAVDELLVAGNTLYAGGNFTAAGGNSASKVATWDGSSWAPVGSPSFNGNVTGMARDDSSGVLYVGGSFTTASATPVNYVAKWNGASWGPLGSGTNNFVESMAIGDDTLYAGGRFTQAGGSATNYVAAWNGSNWSALGSGVDSWVRTLAFDDTHGLLYVGGDFTSAGGKTANRVAVWDSGVAEWIPLTRGANNGVCCNSVEVLATDDSILYLAGQFSLAGGVGAYPIARWTWDPPADLALSDDSGAVGDTLTITGARLIGVNSVLIDDSPAQFTRDDSTQITVTIPPGVFIDDTIHVSAVGGVRGVAPFTSQARLHYDANGAYTGSVPTDDTVYLSGSVATVQGNSGALSRSGYEFMGWNTNASGLGTTYSADDTFTILSDDTLYATWAAIPDPPPPPTPTLPGPPESTSATAGDASAVVSWSAPTSSGSYPVTYYLATSSPGGRTCLTSGLSCTVEGLTNGTAYTFTVQALTGAGWSASSLPSEAVTPEAPARPTIAITGAREGKRISVAGSTTGMGMGAILHPWIKVAGQSAYSKGSASVLVSMDGTFTWSRRTSREASVYLQTPDGSARSNTVTISAR